MGNRLANGEYLSTLAPLAAELGFYALATRDSVGDVK